MNLPEFGVEAWLNKWEKSAKYDISQSSIDSLTLEELIGLDGTKVEDFFAQHSTDKLNYGWIEGSPEFKELVAELYQNMPADNILQTNGATGANMLAIYTLVEAGDEVISMIPSYQQLYDIPRSLGVKVKLLNLDEKQDWSFKIDELKELVTPKTKLICLNNANNPTGTVFDTDFMEEVVKIAKEVDSYILVDEVYMPLNKDRKFVSIVDMYDKGIATNSLSKTFSLPGLRIGWTASNKEVADIFRKFRDYTVICGGVLNDALAVHALKNRDKILQRNEEIVKNNLEIVENWLKTEPRVSWCTPHSVSTSFIKLDIPQDDYSFCEDLLREKGVLLVPGTAFDRPQHARLGYCCNPKILQQGLEKLSEYLRKFD